MQVPVRRADAPTQFFDFHGKMPGCCTNSKGGVAAYKIFDDPEVRAQVLNLLNKGTQWSGPSHQ